MDKGKVGIEGSVSESARFWDQYGWVDQGGGELGEDRLSRRFPPAYSEYTARSADRTLALFADRGGSLLIVGCGDMPESHVRIAVGFHQVTCMDISAVALGVAERKLGPSASYRRESIVETTLPDGQFDAAFCAHTIYHISKDKQADAIRQLVRVIKPGGRVIIVYANPWSPFAIPGEILRNVKQVSPWRGGTAPGATPFVYYNAHSLGWWRRFATESEVNFMPWEVIGSRPAMALLRRDRMAAAFFHSAAWFETKFPRTAVRLWQYPIVVLDRKACPQAAQSATSARDHLRT